MASNDDEDRIAILLRRKRWIALALGAATTSACAIAQPCLRVAQDAARTDAGATDAGATPDAADDEPDTGN